MSVAPRERQTVKNEFIVHFKTRSFDLSKFRAAILANMSAEKVDAIVAAIAVKNEAERASFVDAIEQLGGTVKENWWVINSSWVAIQANQLAAVKALPNVASVEPNYVWYPMLRDSTNASNHNSDAANLMRGLGGALVNGRGITAAVLDTGIDANMGGTGRPHRSFFVNGDPNNKTGGGLSGSRVLLAASLGFGSEDDNSHGTMVSSCIGSAWGRDSGFAPGAGIVSWKVSANRQGGSNSGIITGGWQRVMSNRARYNIKVANNSYSGSPRFTETTQRTLDSVARNGDVLICLPAGNSATNLNGTQAGYNAISVGSNNKYSTRVSSFSGRGTSPVGKAVPDLVAIGSGVIMTAFDRENSLFRASGTSFSSPSCAGAAVLVRHANTKLTAMETKAILINSVRPNTTNASLGAGVLQADRAVAAAIKKQVLTSKLTTNKKSENFRFPVQRGAFHSVTVTWFRQNFSSGANDNLDLTIFDPQNRIVGSSKRGSANSYERVGFTAAATGTYRAVVDGRLISGSVDYAIAGAGTPVPPKKPTLATISPKQRPIASFGLVTLTGTDLDTVDSVLVGSAKVSPTTATATKLTFSPPLATAIGPVTVTVHNPAGTSNGLTLTYVGQHPPKLDALPLLFTGTVYTDSLFNDAGWVGLNYLSGSNAASKAPGLVDLGIGANFTNLVLFNVFVCNKGGFASFSWKMPPGFIGLTFYYQTASFDPKAPKFPLETSNVVTRRVIL